MKITKSHNLQDTNMRNKSEAQGDSIICNEGVKLHSEPMSTLELNARRCCSANTILYNTLRN